MFVHIVDQQIGQKSVLNVYFCKFFFVEEMKLSERLRANCLVTARNGFDLVVSFIRLYCKCICIGIKSFKNYIILFINKLSISSKYLLYKKNNK